MHVHVATSFLTPHMDDEAPMARLYRPRVWNLSSPSPLLPPRAIVSKMAETELDYMIQELVATKVRRL